MGFTAPTFEQTRDRYLVAVRNLRPDAATGPDSDHYVRACAVAAVAEQLHAHIVWVLRQFFPDTADQDYLLKFAAQRGVNRQVAKRATGLVRFTGSASSVVPAGVRVTTTLATYITDSAATVPVGGIVDVAATCEVTGEAYNLSAPTSATISGAPSTIATAQVLAMTGGADDEDIGALLERLLVVMAQPAQGGNSNDYAVWAREVPGVAKAYVFPLRRGIGTVDVVPMPAAGLPSAQLLSDVQAYIDARKPVGMGTTGFRAVAPTLLATAVTGTLTLASGYTLGQVLPPISTALQVLFGGLNPGDTLRVTQVVGAIVSVPGVVDVALTAPTANRVPVVDVTKIELVTLGNIALGV